MVLSMKKNLNLFFIGLVVFIGICSTGCAVRYNHARVGIVNNYDKNMVYVGLFIDEQSGDASGDMIVKVVPPARRPLPVGERDYLDLVWGGGYGSVKFAFSFGFYDASEDSYNVYDCSTDYLELEEGDEKVFRIDSTDDYFVN
ncbi:MAG: hypothetical protein BWX91_02231 [Spirochaetes bacterium ADurb.Bin133]|nr:MAG: hypothetical protein BWX91_02231 [Spirochaetes bacterium ADurb.Bin133]